MLPAFTRLKQRTMPILVTVPGIMSDARTWAPLAEALYPRLAGVHVADTTRDATLEEMAARALTATEGPLIVAAHSMGGRVALEMGRQAPARIKAMILSSTGAEPAGPGEPAHRQTRIDQANADMTRFARDWAPKVLAPENRSDEALLARVRAMVEACPAEVHERQNRALLVRPDAFAYIGAFNFPVLLMTGEHDHLSTPEVHAGIAKAIPDAESRVIPRAGHLLPFEQRERVSELVSDWLTARGIL